MKLELAKTLPRHWRLIIIIASVLLGPLVATTGLGVSPEQSLRSIRDSWRNRPVDGQLQIIEIDPKSIRALSRWPWPRGAHARLVDRLNSAGVRQIGFDVDFSSPSIEAQDKQFARSIARSRATVFLPTLRQSLDSTGTGVADSVPLPAFAKNALTASVNVTADDDGVMRQMALGQDTAGKPRPSLAAQLAGRSGNSDMTFPIDYGIDLVSIPRHSFIDVIEGRVPAKVLAGKDVIVGATAIELGDRYPVPRFGVVPGVYVQAMATETLRRGIPTTLSFWVAVILILPALIGVVYLQTTIRIVSLVAFSATSIFLLALASESWWSLTASIIPALVVLMFGAIATVAANRLRRTFKASLHDSATGLPNTRAWLRADKAASAAIVLTLPKYDAIVSLLGETDVALFIKRLLERLAPALDDATVYRINDRSIGWELGECDFSQLTQKMASLDRQLLHPIEFTGHQLDVQTGIGVAVIDARGKSAAITGALGAAGYAAQRGLKWHLNDGENRDADERELTLLGELDVALAQEEIFVVYQPKLALESDTIVSAEALVRWNHPTRGILSPGMFVEAAENNGRIIELTLYVLNVVLRDLVVLANSAIHISAAVNISAKLLGDSDFLGRALTMIEASGVPPSQLIFEITESAAILAPADALTSIARLRDKGVAISLDDYGTGQSSLAYLKKFQVDELKIDASFVRNVHCDGKDRILVRSTIELAHEMGIKVVGEGVEDIDCLEMLRTLKCDIVQGYLISQPLIAHRLRDFVLEHQDTYKIAV
ncbi:EAL domain-containing protein [Sphingorhabdus soli]|uniref:EAL domain-containing protein n=1 Tax=Flavisphingopyxis soli TaxID=2601267 RepID=A0A5C6U8Y7_9SPHN|nr:EAL domain-containing protein [Sphingorhabdus soli]TXC69264.1 EAL domain-containing protein [Sphingorhabdus soli]